MELDFSIENVIYNNPENGYSVVSGTEASSGLTVTVVFKNGLMNPRKSMTISAEGDWMMSQKYGRQFVATKYNEIEPTSTKGIVAYLSCGLFKGIGKGFATKLVEAFGKRTLEVLENNPDMALQLKGIGKKKLKALIDGLKEHKHVQGVIEFFSEYNISITMIMKIYKKYGGDSIRLVKENPYRLCYEVDGFGFKKSDEIALNMGIDRHSTNRISACADFVLNEAGDDGHTFLHKDEFLRAMTDLLSIETDYINGTIDNMAEEGEIVKYDEDTFFSSNLYYQETNVNFKLKRLLREQGKPLVYHEEMVRRVQEDLGVEYNSQQVKAIKTAVESKVMVLTGGPGTGKTTVLLGLINILSELGLKILTAAPTGMAAKRMSLVTKTNAMTIHRLLEYKPNEGFQRNEETPLDGEVIVIDEISMVNVTLMSYLLNAVKPKSRLILVGDENQLPAIGPGNILHDIIDSKVVPVVTLTEIFRQEGDSSIVLNAHNIVNERPLQIDNKKEGNDLFFVRETNPVFVEDKIRDYVVNRLPKKYGYKPKDIQVLSPRRKNIGCCANDLSKMLQEAINPNGEELKIGTNVYRVGDKVMQIKNDYDNEVFNGDVGFVNSIDNENKTMSVTYYGNVVDYDVSNIDEVTLAYASTIHKSQGSEYPIVIIPLLKAFSIMLKRNLIYTAITRAKKVCIIIGDPVALQMAIKDNSYSKRNTKLRDWLAGEK